MNAYFDYESEVPIKAESLMVSEAITSKDHRVVSPIKGRYFSKQPFGQSHSKTIGTNEAIKSDAENVMNAKVSSTHRRFSFLSRFFRKKSQDD